MPFPDGEIDITEKVDQPHPHVVPASLGFAFTQLIDRGDLDDCLEVIGMHLADRRRALRGHRPRQPRT